jgi:dihydrofolate reductase
MITIIVAVSKNNCIGKDGKMPWHLPEEMKHFKRNTIHKKVVVGRKTFEGFKKPLVDRIHYVVTQQDLELNIENVHVIHDVQELIQKYKNSEEELMVIGGSKIYSLFMDVADKLIISVLHEEYEGDTYFPEFDRNKFEIKEIENYQEFDVYIWIRKEN